MSTDTEDLLWRRFNEWFRARRPDYPSEWDAYEAGHAAGVADERERCALQATDLAAEAAVEYASGYTVDFQRVVGDAIRAGGAKEAGDG